MAAWKATDYAMSPQGKHRLTEENGRKGKWTVTPKSVNGKPGETASQRKKRDVKAARMFRDRSKAATAKKTAAAPKAKKTLVDETGVSMQVTTTPDDRADDWATEQLSGGASRKKKVQSEADAKAVLKAWVSGSRATELRPHSHAERDAAREADMAMRDAALRSEDVDADEDPAESRLLRGERLAAPHSANISTGERLARYHELLGSLGDGVHTCLGCRERGIDHGDHAAHGGLCWRCRKHPRSKSWFNGLDLDLAPPPSDGSADGFVDDQNVQTMYRALDGSPTGPPNALSDALKSTAVSAEARWAWFKLKQRFPSSRVCSSVVICMYLLSRS